MTEFDRAPGSSSEKLTDEEESMTGATGIQEQSRRVGRIRSKMGARYDQESWRAEAECRHVDPEIFFPIGLTGQALVIAAEAKAVCARCPVRLACLQFALDANQQFGIWGGYDEEERRQLRRRRRRPDIPA
jgi:WhiB family redox-sensing transcriptional regulator